MVVPASGIHAAVIGDRRRRHRVVSIHPGHPFDGQVTVFGVFGGLDFEGFDSLGDLSLGIHRVEGDDYDAVFEEGIVQISVIALLNLFSDGPLVDVFTAATYRLGLERNPIALIDAGGSDGEVDIQFLLAPAGRQ